MRAGNPKLQGRKTMIGRILAAALACATIPCAALDLSLPPEALAPVPAYIILNDHPDTLPEVARYAEAILRQIHEQAALKPLLDAQGKRLCDKMSIHLLLVLDKDGRPYDVQVLNQHDFDPQGARRIAQVHLRQIAWSLAPFQPFPLPELLGKRLVGIPITLHLHCRRGR